jgi:hypothetical protein
MSDRTLPPTLRLSVQNYNDTVDLCTLRACLRLTALVTPMAGRLFDGTMIHLPSHFMDTPKKETPPGRG